MSKETGRNDPCPCGSGKKYKKCCGKPGMGRHTAKVLTSDSTNSLLGRISQAGSSFQGNKEEDSAKKALNVTTINKAPAEKKEEEQKD